MPDSERELRMRHTSEGAEKVRADLDKISEGEKRVEEKADDLGKSSEDLGVKKENLTNVLRNVHPALGGLADGLINAAEMAGTLGSANLDLNRIMTVGRSLVLKYKDALLLLGAGGAAFLAIQMLIKAWQDLAAAEREAVEAAQAFQKQQSTIAERSEVVRQQIGRALIRQTGGRVSDEEITRAHAEYRRYVREYEMEPERAMRIAIGEEAPPTQSELDAQRRLIGGGYAERKRELRRQAIQATPTRTLTGPAAMYSGDTRKLREYVEENVAGEDIKEVLEEMAELVTEWQKIIGTRSPGQRGSRNVQREAKRMLLELGITEEAFQPGGKFGPPPVSPTTAPAVAPASPPEATPASGSGQRATDEATKQAAFLLRESATSLDETTRRLASAVEHFDSAAERANQNRLRHGTTPRREAIAMREG